MDNLRTEIWDHLFRSGPQSVEQIAGSLRVDRVTVDAAVAHEWFETLAAEVRIAGGRASTSSKD